MELPIPPEKRQFSYFWCDCMESSNDPGLPGNEGFCWLVQLWKFSGGSDAGHSRSLMMDLSRDRMRA